MDGDRRRIRQLGLHPGEGRGKKRGRRSIDSALEHALAFNGSESEDEAPAGKENSNGNASVLGALREQEKRQGEAKRQVFSAPAEDSAEMDHLILGDEAPRQVVRRRVNQKSRSHVAQVEEAKEGAAGQGTSPDKEEAARFRPRGAAAGTGAVGKSAGTKRSGKSAADSGDEYEPGDEELERWQQDLITRQGSKEDPRSAFSLKPVSPQEMRLLSPDCFLGGRKGGKPLFNSEGRVSLQFLLATYRSGEKLREKNGKDGGEDSEAERAFLRWLVKKARELKLVSSKEVRSGAISKQRLMRCKESANWALVEANLADASDEEGLQKQKAAAEKANAAKALGVTQLDVAFPTARRTCASDGEAKGAKLKSHVTERKENINVASSHGVDLRKMRDVLTAPSLSFDWSEKEAEEEDDPLADGLEVDVPDMISKAEEKRNMWRDHLKRSVSFNQAKSLAKVNRQDSDGSLASEQEKAALKKKKSSRALFKEKEGSKTEKKSSEAEAVPAAKVPELATGSSDLWSRISARASPTKPDASENSMAEEAKPSLQEPAAATSEKIDRKDVPCEKDLPPAKDLALPEKEVLPSQNELPKPDESRDDGLDPDPEAALEISPTLPFKALGNDEDIEISPTLPFVPVVEAIQEPSDKVTEEAPAIQNNILEASDELREKRPAEAMAENTESSDEAEDPDGVEQEGLEVTEADKERIQREREWHRHKRRAMRKEMKSQQALAKSKEKSIHREKKLGTTTMTEEDRKRFEAVVSGNSSNPSGMEDEDLMVPQRRSFVKKPSFLGSKKS